MQPPLGDSVRGVGSGNVRTAFRLSLESVRIPFDSVILNGKELANENPPKGKRSTHAPSDDV